MSLPDGQYFDRFLTIYESRFEKEYGHFRPVVREVAERYLDCGDPRSGFARIRCPDCRREHLLTSARGRDILLFVKGRVDQESAAGDIRSIANFRSALKQAEIGLPFELGVISRLRRALT